MPTAAHPRMPTLFIPHGAGPCFFMDWHPPDAWDRTAAFLRAIPDSLPAPPTAIVLVTAHWLAPQPSLGSAAQPGLLFDYHGFPPHTYALTYPAPGAPALAERAATLLAAAGFMPRLDGERGYDHGCFIPLKVAFPAADVPVLQLSLLVPIAFGILAVMLFFALGQLRLVATALLSLPFALAGGVLGLRLAGLPFSIPAGVGFIALSGVAVMSAVVLCTRWAELPADDASFDRVLQATRDTLRARITAALVPAIGFVPMVISTGAGAEVQKPLAVVVIGGLAVSLVLGLVALPVLLLVLSPAPEAVVSPADELELANGNPH